LLYEFFSMISRWVSSPFAHAAQSSNIALMAVLFFGFAGSIAPCQMSANLGSIAYFGNRFMQSRLKAFEFAFYLIGKMTVFSILGLLFWWFGREISTDAIPLYVYARKLVGPLIILIGLFFLGWVKLPGSFGFRASNYINQFAERIGGIKGAFLMGAAFSLAFCPTMVWLFFGLVMPITISSGYGFVLPSVFAVGTAMPLLLFVGLMIGFGLDRVLIKKMKQWGRWVQKFAGILLVLLGIGDTLTYWTY
jgi:cytochrome c-type biogenesis protein